MESLCHTRQPQLTDYSGTSFRSPTKDLRCHVSELHVREHIVGGIVSCELSPGDGAALW